MLMIYRIVPFTMTLTPNTDFKGTPLLDLEYLENGIIKL